MYPTPNNGVGIIDVTQDVREELSNQCGRGGWSISKRDNQPLDSRLALMAGSTSFKITERSAQFYAYYSVSQKPYDTGRS